MNLLLQCSSSWYHRPLQVPLMQCSSSSYQEAPYFWVVDPSVVVDPVVVEPVAAVLVVSALDR